MSGTLFVEKVTDGKYAMDFPSYETMPVEEYSEWLEDGKVPQYVRDIAKVSICFSRSAAHIRFLRVCSV